MQSPLFSESVSNAPSQQFISPLFMKEAVDEDCRSPVIQSKPAGYNYANSGSAH